MGNCLKREIGIDNEKKSIEQEQYESIKNQIVKFSLYRLQ